MSLMIVDDIPAVHEMLVPLFQNQGFTTYGVLTAKEALNILAQHAVEVALIDYSMPEYDGLELTQEIMKTYPHVRVILMSGYFDVELRRKATLAGVHAIVEKPFELKSLIALVQQRDATVD